MTNETPKKPLTKEVTKAKDKNEIVCGVAKKKTEVVLRKVLVPVLFGT